MTIYECAQFLLTYFSPEERSFPVESNTYLGRHLAVRKAMNDALQYLFGKGGAWVRKDERGHLVNAPVQVPIVVTQGSKNATIAAEDWQDWFAGCAIVIDGSATENRIRNDSRNVVLKFPHDGASSTVFYSEATVSGTLEIDYGAGAEAITFPAMPWDLLTFPVGYRDGRLAFLNTNRSPIYYCQWYSSESKWKLGISGYGPDETDSIVWESTADVATPDLVPTGEWHATNNPDAWKIKSSPPDPTGTPVVSVATTMTPVVATIYHDSVSVDADVLEIIKPVFLNRVPLTVRSQPYDMGSRIDADEDFGGEVQSDIVPVVPSILQTAGTPRQCAVETWGPGATEAARIRIRLYPAPSAQGFLDYRAFILPPSVASITATTELPVPFEFVESVFLPIAIKKLKSCPFWRGIVSDQQVDDGFAAALEQLSEIAPKQTGGMIFVPKY